MRLNADRSGENTRRTGLGWIAARVGDLYRRTLRHRAGRNQPPIAPTEPLARAYFVADQVLRDPTRCAFRLDDGSLLVLDERMPRDFVAVASRTGAVIVRPLTQ